MSRHRQELHPHCRRARVARSLRGLAGVRGWQRLVNWLVPVTCAGCFRVDNNGRLFEGDLKSFIDRNVYLFGGYEDQQIERFLSWVPSGRRRTILDVGANVGTHALAFADVFAEVHAFEPNPSLWVQFEKNAALNRKANITLHRTGLGNEESDRPFYMIEKENHGLGTFSAVEQYDLPLKQVGVARLTHGARYLGSRHITSIDAVKIDVQGFELEVLRGLAPILDRDEPIVWLELSAETLGAAAGVEALNRLFAYPFEARSLTSSSQAPVHVFSRELIPGDYVVTPS